MRFTLSSFLAVAFLLFVTNPVVADFSVTNNASISSFVTGNVSQSVNVGFDEEIEDISVTLTGLSHEFIGEFSIRLTSPDNTSQFLIGQGIGGGFGDDSNLDGTYTFADSGASLWDAAVAAGTSEVIAGGTYVASENAAGVEQINNLQASFTGLSTSGVWTLSFFDSNVLTDDGSLGSWTLNFNTVPEPGSATLFVLGTASLLCRRRR